MVLQSWLIFTLSNTKLAAFCLSVSPPSGVSFGSFWHHDVGLITFLFESLEVFLRSIGKRGAPC